MTIPTRSLSSLPTRQVKYPKGEGYNALLDDFWVRTAPNRELPIRMFTRDSLAQRNDDRGSVYENVLDIGYAFARGDVSGGEGLDWYPRFIAQLQENEALDRIRYFDSNNIEVRRPLRGEPARIELSRDMQEWSSGQTYTDLATSDSYFYVAYGATVERWDDWDGGTPINSATASSTIVRIEASPSGDLMALLDNGTIEYLENVSTTFLALTTPLVDVTRHWFAKGRFIAEVNLGSGLRGLVEFNKDGAVPFGEFDTIEGEYLSVVSSGPAVVAACSDGTVRTYVPEQSNQLEATSVSLVIRGRTEMPEGETPFMLGSNADILLILTRTSGQAGTNDIRVYQSEVLDARFDYSVGQVQLRREWLDTNELPDDLKNMANTRDEIWFAINETNTAEMLWRFDLVTTGLSRQLTVDTAQNGHSLIVFDKNIGVVLGTAVWSTVDDYKSEGWLITPNITFGVNTDISWLALALTAENLVNTGKQVEIWYTTDRTAILDESSPSWRLGLRASAPLQEELEALLTKVTGRQLALMLRIFSSEGNSRTPRVSNFAVRGIPNQRDWILQLPVNVSDYVEVPGRTPIHVPNHGQLLHEKVQALAGLPIEAIVLDPSFAIRGIVDNVAEPVEYVSDRGAVSVRTIVEIRGEKITQTVNPVGDAGLGLGLLGVSTLGIGQTIRT